MDLLILESESEVAQSCPTLCHPMDCRLLRPWDFPGKSTVVGCNFLLHFNSRVFFRKLLKYGCRGSTPFQNKMILFSTFKQIDDMPLSPFLCLFSSPLRSSEAGLKRWERFELDKIEHLWLLSLLQSAPGCTASPEVPSGAWACRVSLCTSFELALWPGVGGFLAPGFMNFNITISSVQFSHSVMSDSLWLHGLQHARPPCPSPTPSLLKLMSIELVMPSNHLILCRPLLLPSIFPTIKVFSNESALHIRWPKYWSFSFNISPSNEHLGLISFILFYFFEI